MKAKKCTECLNETHQADGVCVLCKLGLSAMSLELKDLLKSDNKSNFQKMKAAKVR